MKTQFIRTIILLGIVIGIYFLISCSLDTPEAPQHDNPWDPANPSPPRAPVNLLGHVLSETSLSLSWEDQSGNETGFIIEQGEGDLPQDSLWSAVDTVDANTVTATLQDRHPATEYRYRVLAVNPAGKSTPTELVLFLNTADAAPTQPIGLTVERIDGLRVQLRWLDLSANEIEFDIEGGVSPQVYTELAHAPANSTSWISGDLRPFEEYNFRIRATNTYGKSAYVTAGPLIPGQTALSAPFAVTASAISESQIHIQWNDSNIIAERFLLRESVGDTDTFQQIAVIGIDSLEIILNGRTPNTTYYYLLVAQNRLRTSPASNFDRASTAEVVPLPPSLASAAIEDELTVRLTWQDNSDIETGFELAESYDNSQNYVTLDTIPASSTILQIPRCIPYETKHYRLRSLGEFGASVWLNFPPVTPGGFAPKPPTSLSAVALSPHEIRLNWLDNSQIEENYEIVVRNGIYWTLERTLPAETTNHIFNNLQPNSTHAYNVRAVNRFGVSQYTSAVEVTTPGPPVAPTNLVATGDSPTRITLNWSMAENANQSGFIIEDSLVGSVGWTHVDSVKSPAIRSYRFENSPRFVANYFRIKSFNEYGSSLWSNIDPGMPHSLVAFVACNETGVVAVDVTDPTNPERISSIITPGFALKPIIAGDRLFLACSQGGIACLDISSPSQMVQMDFSGTNTRAYDVTTDSAGYLFVGENEGIEVFDVRDPANLRPVASYSTGTTVQRVLYYSNRLYASCSDAGTLRFDVTNRNSAPILRATGATGSAAFSAALYGQLSIMTAEYASGVKARGYNDLVESDGVDLGGNVTDITQRAGQSFYAAAGRRIVSLFGVSELGSLATPDDIWQLKCYEDRLYACADNAGLLIYNVFNGTSLELFSNFRTPGPARGVAVREYK